MCIGICYYVIIPWNAGAKPERYCVPQSSCMTGICVILLYAYNNIRRCTLVDRKPTLNRPPRDTVRKRVKRTAVMRRPAIYTDRCEHIVYNYYDGREDAYKTIIKL